MATQFEGAARGPDVLVVVVLTGREVLAEPTARQARHRTADAHKVADRRRGGYDGIGLVIGAIGRADLEVGLVRKRLGHVLHRAADGVAAVERALRTAQHFDALDVVDVEHRRLRAVEIDVVEIDADALLEARNRILLADAADEG